MDWKFDPADYDPNKEGYETLPVGDYRVRIESAEEKTSQNGNQMIAMTLEVSGKNSRIWHNLVLLADNRAATNQRLGAIFDSFKFAPTLDLNKWVGKVGACRVKHDTYNGKTSAKVAYFITHDKQDKLAPWEEPPAKASVTGGADAPKMVELSPDDLPFN